MNAIQTALKPDKTECMESFVLGLLRLNVNGYSRPLQLILPVRLFDLRSVTEGNDFRVTLRTRTKPTPNDVLCST